MPRGERLDRVVRRAACALCAALVVPVLVVPALTIPAASAPAPSSTTPAEVRPADPLDARVPDGVPRSCSGEYAVNVQRATDISAVTSRGFVMFDGVRVPVTGTGLRDAADLGPPDASWQQWFHALVWLLPLAIDHPARAVDLAVRHAGALRDPGPDATKEVLQRTGWTPGTIRNRLEVARCLFKMTGDRALLPVGRALGDALLDPRRYPGLPLNPPHNHGILTNRVMIQAASIFARPEWRRVSYGRLRRDLPHVFSRCGMVFEQSTGYQALNLSLWSAFPEIASRELASARSALAALIRPDGVLEQIGDGQARVGIPNRERLWCPGTGWAANTVGGMHYILRFGPPTSGHGHADHGAPTWFTAGVPVLSDRGLFDKALDARREFAVSQAAHSVLEPLGVPDFLPETAARRVGADSYVLTDSSAGISRKRAVDFTRRMLTVTDEARSSRSGAARQVWVQHWQLAPGWYPTTYGARHTSGVRLTVDCSGGTVAAVQVESYPGWREAVPAWDLQCRATGASVRLMTTLTLR